MGQLSQCYQNEGKMRLHSIEYTEYGDQPFRWSLEELTLININLIVGKNSSGKSRLLRIIIGLARLIEGGIQPLTMASGHYKAVLVDQPLPSKEEKPTKPDITYEIEIHNGKVQK